MAIEIERKFLVQDDRWRAHADGGTRYRQGYLNSDPTCSVRVRIAGEGAWLSVKSATSPIRRLEYEYPIPVADADEMLDRVCKGAPVEKTRFHVRHAGHLWEVDVFAGANSGLVVAEIELEHEEEHFDRPDWLGAEVSDDPRYYNMNLARQPFSQW